LRQSGGVSVASTVVNRRSQFSLIQPWQLQQIQLGIPRRLFDRRNPIHASDAALSDDTIRLRQRTWVASSPKVGGLGPCLQAADFDYSNDLRDRWGLSALQRRPVAGSWPCPAATQRSPPCRLA